MEDRPSNWQFTLLAPVYDWLMVLRPRGEFPEWELPSTSNVLDLGGGTGRSLEAAVEPAKFEQKVVLDLNRAMLRQGRRLRDYDFVAGDAKQLPFAAGSFDLVLACDSLHHIGDPDDVFAELNRILTENGAVFIEEFNPQGLSGKIAKLGEYALGMKSHFLVPEQLKDIARANNFKIESFEVTSLYQRLLGHL